MVDKKQKISGLIGAVALCGTVWAEPISYKSGTYEVDGSTFGQDVTEVVFSQSDGTCKVTFGPGTYGPKFKVGHETGWDAAKQAFATFSGGSLVFTKRFTVFDTCWDLPLDIDTGTSVVFEGGVSNGYSWDWFVFFRFYGGKGSVTIRNTPLDVSSKRGLLLYSWGSATMTLDVANNKINNILQLTGPVTLKTTCDWALSTNTYATALAFVKEDGMDGAVLDLCGHDQAVGRLDTKGMHSASGTPSSTGKIRSDSPATLHVRQAGGDAVTTFPLPFEGGAGLCKSGADELVLAGVSTTTGRLEVAEGVLSFSGSGCWNMAREIAVSGGTLKVDDNQRLAGRLATITYSGGELNLAQGVVVRVREFIVDDGVGSHTLAADTYTAADLPGILGGAGELQVVGGGMILNIR